MRLYIDTPLILDYIEANPPYSGAVNARIARGGVDTLFTPFSRMECLAVALDPATRVTRLDVDVFFAPGVLLPMTNDVYERAAEIRATYHFAVVDSIHLAAATVHGCDEFLTRKRRLKRYAAVRVEVV
jgi:predicted nucleic acid-binding protein